MSPVIFLIDNGSLRPEATLALRDLAAQLSARTDLWVTPVSLLHSSKVPADELGGLAAQVVKPALRHFIEAGARSFIFLPLFLGPSRGVTDYLPQLIEEARMRAPDLEVVIADALCGADVDAPDVRLVEIMAAHVRAVVREQSIDLPQVALVDHGTPVEVVNRVRNAVARQLVELLGSEVATVVASSMERRAGSEYDFNEPLLEQVDQVESIQSQGDLVVALFFLLPGRHAGADGDVAQICAGLSEGAVFRSIVTTPLIATHPLLLDILSDRLSEALKQVNAAGA